MLGTHGEDDANPKPAEPDSTATAHSPPATGQAKERRADARRNVAAILDAALLCLARDPDASIAEIAQAAGVGRVTLYGHFKSRADLIEAVLSRTVQHADAVLDATDTSGDPRAALLQLVASSWQIVDQFRSVLTAAQHELPAQQIRPATTRSCTGSMRSSTAGSARGYSGPTCPPSGWSASRTP